MYTLSFDSCMFSRVYKKVLKCDLRQHTPFDMIVWLGYTTDSLAGQMKLPTNFVIYSGIFGLELYNRIIEIRVIPKGE